MCRPAVGAGAAIGVGRRQHFGFGTGEFGQVFARGLDELELVVGAFGQFLRVDRGFEGCVVVL